MITGQKIKTFPLDKETEQALKELKRKLKLTDSFIIRTAIKEYYKTIKN